MDLSDFRKHYQLSEHQLSMMMEHLNWVIETNSRLRLTAIDDFDLGMRLHVADSLEVLNHLREAPEGPVLDMGSGGGFPGIPIAIMSERDVVCLDSVQKKMNALAEYIKGFPELVDRVSTAPVRAEELAVSDPDTFSVVVARALSALPSLVELSAPLLVKGGQLVAMKGNIDASELISGARAASKCGLEQIEIRKYQLYGGQEARAIVVYRKVAQPEILLPRRIGLAQRRPLA